MYSQKGWIKEWIPCLLSHSLAVAGPRAGIEPPNFQMRGQSICQSLTGCQLVITNMSSFALFCLQQKLHTLQHSGSIANIIVNSSRHFYSIITSVSPSVSGLKTQRNKKSSPIITVKQRLNLIWKMMSSHAAISLKNVHTADFRVLLTNWRLLSVIWK